MRMLFLVLLLVAVAGGSYVVVNAEKVPVVAPVEERLASSLKDSNARVKPSIEAPKALRKSASQNRQRVRCPLCDGERHILRIQKGVVSRERSGACILCSEKGFRDVVLRRGESICENCGGMGFKVRIKKPYVSMNQAAKQGWVEDYFANNPRVTTISIPSPNGRYKGGAGEFVKYACRANWLPGLAPGTV